MKSNEVRTKYIEFFQDKKHAFIPSAPLVTQNDPTTLLVSSGMQPLLNYFLGEKHPNGTRIVDSQIAIRAQGITNDDTLEVGDNRHTTCFEMLGNWSFGDYFKKEQIQWISEFLFDVIKLDPQKIYVTAYSGDDKYNIPKDSESVEIWKTIFKERQIEANEIEMGTEKDAASKGMQGSRIFYYKDKNWWSRSGLPQNMPVGEPGGPDSELFYDFGTKHDKAYGENCHPNCDCGKFLELGNSVFMQYQKKDENTFVLLPNKNVDFGGGLERITAASMNEADIFKTDLHYSIIEKIEIVSGLKYEGKDRASMRLIADHVKGSTFLIAQGVLPANKMQGYILRKLIRRAYVKMYMLNSEVTSESFAELADEVVKIYEDLDDGYGFKLELSQSDHIKQIISEEISRFSTTLKNGLKLFNKISDSEITENFAFDLFQSSGFPFEITFDLAKQKGVELDRTKFNKLFEEHQKKSRAGASEMFKGGLADTSEQTTRLHTATHLLHKALREVLGNHVKQMGSNITAERLRFDFSHFEKMTDEQIAKVEQIVNEKIQEKLPVQSEILSKADAEKTGAIHFFGDKYGDKVTVYYIGDDLKTAWSKEFCGGPHVKNTSEIGKFKIIKEESASRGVRRIKAIAT